MGWGTPVMPGGELPARLLERTTLNKSIFTVWRVPRGLPTGPSRAVGPPHPFWAPDPRLGCSHAHPVMLSLSRAVFICSFMVAAPVFGYLGDRFNRKVILSCGIFFWSAVTFSSSFIPQQVRPVGLPSRHPRSPPACLLPPGPPPLLDCLLLDGGGSLCWSPRPLSSKCSGLRGLGYFCKRVMQTRPSPCWPEPGDLEPCVACSFRAASDSGRRQGTAEPSGLGVRALWF